MTPRHIQTRYLRGKCDILARACLERPGFSLWGLLGAQNVLEHVFVRHDSGSAFDIRGARPVEAIPAGSRLEDLPHELREISLEELEHQFGIPDDHELEEARGILEQWLWRDLEDIERSVYPQPGVS